MLGTEGPVRKQGGKKVSDGAGAAVGAVAPAAAKAIAAGKKVGSDPQGGSPVHGRGELHGTTCHSTNMCLFMWWQAQTVVDFYRFQQRNKRRDGGCSRG